MCPVYQERMVQKKIPILTPHSTQWSYHARFSSVWRSARSPCLSSSVVKTKTEQLNFPRDRTKRKQATSQLTLNNVNYCICQNKRAIVINNNGTSQRQAPGYFRCIPISRKLITEHVHLWMDLLRMLEWVFQNNIFLFLMNSLALAKVRIQLKRRASKPSMPCRQLWRCCLTFTVNLARRKSTPR